MKKNTKHFYANNPPSLAFATSINALQGNKHTYAHIFNKSCYTWPLFQNRTTRVSIMFSTQLLLRECSEPALWNALKSLALAKHKCTWKTTSERPPKFPHPSGIRLPCNPLSSCFCYKSRLEKDTTDILPNSFVSQGWLGYHTAIVSLVACSPQFHEI